MKVTTNPVELWAGPTSESKLDKNYFDSHFEPFYRSQQVIIMTKNMKHFYHNSTDGPEIFGPVFNKTFMYEVLRLQNHILHEVSYIAICLQ